MANGEVERTCSRTNLIKLCFQYDKELLSALCRGAETAAFRLVERASLADYQLPIRIHRFYRTEPAMLDVILSILLCTRDICEIFVRNTSVDRKDDFSPDGNIELRSNLMLYMGNFGIVKRIVLNGRRVAQIFI